MIKIAIPLLVALALLALPAQIKAKELANPLSGCSLTVPDSWELIPVPPNDNFAAAARNPKKSESISFFTIPTSTLVLDENADYVRGFLDSVQKQGLSVTKKEHRMQGGRDFYVITCIRHEVIDITMTAWLTLANSRIYQIGLTAPSSAPAADLNTALQSFHFLK